MDGDAHSRSDNLRTHKYPTDLARNLEPLPIKIPTSFALDWQRMELVRSHAERSKATSWTSPYAFVRNGRLISIRRLNA